MLALLIPPRVLLTGRSWRDNPSRLPMSASSAACSGVPERSSTTVIRRSTSRWARRSGRDACRSSRSSRAGTITCNYDGANKHKTTIGDGAFIGSGVELVAPVEIGKNATIGAGASPELARALFDGGATVVISDIVQSDVDAACSDIAGSPEDERIAVTLRYFGRYRAAEIARMVDAPPSTIRSRIRSGLHKLREELEP